MTMHSLPPVAKSFFTFCKKCDADRYHVVLAHTSSKTAKIECEICHSKKSYSLPKEGAAKTAKTASGKALTGAAAAKREASANARRSSHNNEYTMLMDKDVDVVPYTMKAKFAKSTKINHPKFGMGFVRDAMPDKIEVVFSDEVRTLIHNRP